MTGSRDSTDAHGNGPHAPDELETSHDTFEALLAAAVCPSDASVPSDPRLRRFERLAIGTVVAERFAIEWFAGAGGMGDVYRCRDRETEAHVALKVIRRLDDSSRFRREAAILAALSHHAIVRYVAHGSTDRGTPFLAMEWLEGEDLGKRLRHGRLTVGEAVSVARRMCEGLALAHGHGFIHRDIKPSNVFLVGGRVEAAKLLDFGIAHRGVTAQTATRAGTVLGTVGYMAPEQASGGTLPDPRGDLFSLGCVLFECLTGQPAFVGESAIAVLENLLHSAPPDLSSLRPDVPDPLAQLVLRLLSKDRHQRPSDAASVARELDVMERAQRSSLGAITGGDETPWQVAATRFLTVVSVHGHDQSDETHARALEHAAETFGARCVRVRDDVLLALASDARVPLVDVVVRARDCAGQLSARLPTSTLSIATYLADRVDDRARDAVAARIAVPVAPSSRGGAVVLDAPTAMLLEARAEVEQDGLPAWVDVEDAATPQPARRFVERAAELAMLDAVLDECVDDEVARTMVITAPAGTGKSRLGAAFVAQVRADGHVRALSVRASWQDRATPLALVRAIVIEAVGDARAAQLVLQEGTFVDVVRAECAAAPVLLWIDDAHWVDRTSMQYLEALVATLAERSLFILATARPEMAEALRARWRATAAQELPLRALTERAATRFLQATHGFEAPDHDVLARALADGNPRLLRAIRDALGHSDGAKFEVAAALLAEHMTDLPDGARNVLCAASAFPEGIWPGGVDAVLSSVPSAAHELPALCEQHLLIARADSGVTDEPEFAFTHTLVRSAAQRLLSQGERASAQERAARWLAQVGATGADD